MRVHLIAMGGSVMHNLALELSASGHAVSGSDDEFYEPSRSRLAAAELLPAEHGWFPDRIIPSLDCVITGMHARKDNPEVLRALDLGLRIYSFPEFYAERCQGKFKIVVAGSHGKTTTTAMIMQVLRGIGKDFDYLVGASLEGFERNVKLSDAPICVIEGDEYLSSPLDLRPKIMHYTPDIAIVTGVAWDHMNVFPTWESYVNVFQDFIKSMKSGTVLIWYSGDKVLADLVRRFGGHVKSVPYKELHTHNTDDPGDSYTLKIFGSHNLQNLSAAMLACAELGITKTQFLSAIKDFTGAALRLELLFSNEKLHVYRDFAHAPSKARATVMAIRERYPEAFVVAFLELHTFSSLNKVFLPQYNGSLAKADHAVIFYSPKTLEMKKMPPVSVSDVTDAFGHDSIEVITSKKMFEERLSFFTGLPEETALLLMSSGRFEGADLNAILQP